MRSRIDYPASAGGGEQAKMEPLYPVQGVFIHSGPNAAGIEAANWGKDGRFIFSLTATVGQ
jgi:hypothetical protein